MKTMLFLSGMLIATSAFAGPKICNSKNDDAKKLRPNHVLIIDFDQLRDQTKDVSILKPVFMIITAITNASEKNHGKNFKSDCNKSSNQSD